MFNEGEKPRRILGIFYFFRSYLHYHFVFKKKFVHIAGLPRIWGIWNIAIYGPNISIGKNVVIVSAHKGNTTITTVRLNGREGRITIGDNVLVMNGVRLSSASAIEIGDDCMLANFCYLTDADWHDIYDRTSSPGRTAPIVLDRGVWIGDSAIVCKGVRIGENSIIGAGAVVRENVPANVVVIGNPARIVKHLDPAKIITMKALYKQEALNEAEAISACAKTVTS